MNTVIHLYDRLSSGIVEYGFIGTPFGKCMVAFNSYGLCAFEFTDDNDTEVVTRLREEWSDAWVDHNRIFDNIAFPEFMTDSDIPLSICLKGTPFQTEVWKVLLQIPYGHTVSYSDIARMMGRPKAVRAIASAIAANRIAFVVPCHRVVRSNGDYGEYRWGKELKKTIIEWENEVACR